jgi:hypothetical protein
MLQLTHIGHLRRWNASSSSGTILHHPVLESGVADCHTAFLHQLFNEVRHW